MKIKQYILIIKIVDNTIILKLNNGNQTVDELKWDDANNNTSKELLKQIDKLLKNNELTIGELSKVKTGIDEKQKFTLARIVKIVAETINYSSKTNGDLVCENKT